MLFDKTAFQETFAEVTDYGRGKEFDPLKRLCGGRGLKKAEDKTAYKNFLKIMLAETVSDLDGIGVEDVLNAWERRNDFETMFDGGCAKDWLKSVRKNLPVMRSTRRRRVL